MPEPDNVRALKGLPPRRPVAAAGDRPSPPEWLDALGADYFSDLTAMAPHLRLADSFLLAQLADNLSTARTSTGRKCARLRSRGTTKGPSAGTRFTSSCGTSKTAPSSCTESLA